MASNKPTVVAQYDFSFSIKRDKQGNPVCQGHRIDINYEDDISRQFW
jgi:hypothetical protein